MKKARPTRAIRVSTKGASRRNSVAPHTVEVPLRNGATVVLTADIGHAETSVEEVETYLSRARTWFELEFDQLELFETNIASIAHRKMASFAELTTTPDWIAPVKIEMRYVAPTTRRGSNHRGAGAIAAGAASSTALSQTDATSSTASPAIVGDTYILPATLSRRTIASAISGAQERGEDWDSDPSALVVFMREGTAAAEVTLRPFSAIKGGTLTERDRETLEIALRAWKEVDQDTLDVLVNNLLENGLNERGWAFASYDAILDARERQKKTKVEGGKRYKAGHRLEDRDEVHKSVHRLANLFADVYPTEEQRRRRRGRAAPVIAIQELEYDLVSGAATGVWYALGSWADTVRDEGILTSRKILAYHPGRQGVEKRLGRHLVALLEASQHPDGIAARRIAEIYDELHLTVEEANPGRTQSRFERALAQLQDDGIIGPWRYEPDLRKRPLPSRGFLADWLSRDLIVRPATASRITLTAKLTR
jgi:hypothetical protein